LAAIWLNLICDDHSYFLSGFSVVFCIKLIKKSHFIVPFNGNTQAQCLKLENVLTGNLLVNNLRPLLVGHWSVNSEASEEAFNLEGKSAPNVFSARDQRELIEVLIDRFSFPGQWALDASNSYGK